MKMFHCKLINDGTIEESIYRVGESAKDVLNRLEMFLWPKGVWFIEETDFNPHDDNSKRK